jgi:hypothetical protein
MFGIHRLLEDPLARPARRRGHGLWSLEGLEDRVVLSPTLFTVTDISDNPSDTGSLRYAINKANADPNSDGSLIQFDPTAFIAPETITVTSTLGLAEKDGPEVISGPGASLVTISGNNAIQVFQVASGVTGTLSGLTITCGHAGYGGGIQNLGTLTVANSSFASNSASVDGGGIENSGTLTVANSTFASNSATYGGGGIYNVDTLTVSNSTFEHSSANYGGGIANYPGKLAVFSSTFASNSAVSGGGIANLISGTMTVTNSTIDHNSAVDGGGIANGGTLTVANSTFASNSAEEYGGGIENGGTLTAINDTIAYDTVASRGSGGGLYVLRGMAALNNTIVAGNTQAGGPDDIAGTVSPSSASNLVGTGGAGGLTNGNGNQVAVANPGLAAALADNGGPTQTIALLPGSPAVDRGSNLMAFDPWTNLPMNTDQRGTGFPRISHNTVDIGAYELQTATQLLVTVQPPGRVTAGAGFGLTVAAEDSSGHVVPWFPDTVTVTLSNNPSRSILGGTTTVTAHNGVAIFADLALTKAGTGYRLQVSRSGLSSTTTNAFDVSAASASQVVVTMPPPASVAAGRPFSLIIAAEDPFGNVDPRFTGAVTVTLETNVGGATLGGTVTVATVHGVAIFTDLTLNRGGNGYALAATSTGLAPATTSTLNILPAVTIVRQQLLTAGNGKHKHLTGFEVVFSAALDPSRARNAANYTVSQTVVRLVKGHRTTVAQPVPIRVVYDAAAHAVSLLLMGQPQFAKGGQIVVSGSPPTGLISTAGGYLDGSGVGLPGSDGVYTILPKGRAVVQ